MILLALSAAFVGLVHSLAPGHWLPVVIMTKTRRWPTRTALLGALTAASGHIILSIVLAIVGIEIGAHVLTQYEAQIENYAGLLLIAFGLIYSLVMFTRHSSCHGHTHHGPKPDSKAPFLFLFSLGFSPCVAVLPVFVAAATRGSAALVASLAGFAFGVVGALSSATLLVRFGVMKLDHPVLEHYGDVITGLSVALLGVVLFVFPALG
jgi:cytochrome c biogenesis protein CcdA